MQLPTIRDQKGSIICQARLEDTNLINFSNVNNIVLQSKMAAVLEQLELLNEQVSDVLQGQYTDRIGTIKGAEATYRQALSMKDSNNRNQLLLNVISELNKGRSQLIESSKNKTKFIDELPETKLKHFVYSVTNKIKPSTIEKKFLETQQIFENIISSSYLIYLTYEELGEINSMRESLSPLKDCIEEYSKKLEKVVEFLPYNPKFENEKSWYKNPDGVLKTIDPNLNLITSNSNDCIEIELTGNQLMLAKERTSVE